MTEERIRELARDGVPVAWIAETVGVSTSHVRIVRDAAGIARTPEWMAVQAAIRKQDTLRELHEQFRPKRRK